MPDVFGFSFANATEDIDSKSLKKSATLRRVLSYVGQHKGVAFVTLMCAAVNVICMLYVPILIGRAIDCIGVNIDPVTIVATLFKAGILVLAAALTQYGVTYWSNRLSSSVVRSIRDEAFDHLMTLPFSYMDSHPAGDIIARIIADADQFADGMLIGFTQLFTGVATIIGTLIFMVSMNWKISIFVVCITPVSLFVAKYISSHTYQMFARQSKLRGQQTGIIEDSLSNSNVIRAFAYEGTMCGRFDEINEPLRDASLRATFFSSLTNPSTRFVNSIVYAGVAFTGALAVLGGGMSVGILTCFLSYANQYTKPFNEISGVITELQGAFACAARIFELLDEKSESKDPDHPSDIDSACGNISIKDVDFSYTADRPLIENMNIEVKSGQRIAIVGPTGCGKTTLINLLMRFYDTNKGSIYIDGIDIRDMSRHGLRRLYGMVLQDTFLTYGTIADNIRMGKPDASIDEVIEAAKKVHAHSFIRRLTDGYETVIGEDGGNLSAGQKQLLCIARIMLLNPNMLILDEATSNIDTRTEIKIQSAFEQLMKGHTSFIVAHRLSTIVSADCILVMKDGHIIETGTHKQLLEKNGFYAELYHSRSAGKEVYS